MLKSNFSRNHNFIMAFQRSIRCSFLGLLLFQLSCGTSAGEKGYNDPPSIAITKPVASEPATSAPSFVITWTASDPDSNPAISLFYNQTGSGYGGTLIAAGMHLSDPVSSYTWNISGLDDGTYYVYATIDDGTTVVSAYAAGPLTVAYAGTEYYVDQNHPAADNQNAGTIDLPWKTIAKANQTVRRGDTVYIKGGTYTSAIAPVNSGTSSKGITYRNYGTDTVTIAGANYAIYLNGKSHITVEGIHAENCAHFLYLINGANHNIIAHSTFNQQNPPDWDASVINGGSQYNWIHHSQFSKGGECTANGADVGSVLDIGLESSSTDLTRYNLIEDNIFFHGGHHVMGLHAGYNTIRNNYFHNEAWSLSAGNRTLYLNGKDAITGHNIIEGNRFGYAARPCDDFTVGNVVITTPYNIFRYNKLYHHNAYGLATYAYSGYSSGSYNTIYNNTIFNSGYNISTDADGSEDTAILFMSSIAIGNRLRNNLYYSNHQVYTGYTAKQTFANEWNGDTQGDPLFVNASATPPDDKTDPNTPNLDLQAASPAINAGGALTTIAAADTGSGTSLVVSDAGYFQDGTFAPSGTVQADWIAVGTSGNAVQISSIDYSTNTLILAAPLSRSVNDPVWLYKKSDGVRVLYDSAPDAGAYEFSP
jgi:hypothetical protein